MTVTAIESGTGDLWQSRQAALGTIAPPADAGQKHLRKVGDDALKAAKTYGSEEWVDGEAFGSPSVYVESIGGDVGSLPFEVQIETGGWAFAQIIGVDTVTGTTPDYTHTISTAKANGAYQTIRQKTGIAIGPVRQAFFDALISKLTFNCGQDQNVAHISQDIVALKAAQWFGTDPTAADSGTDPFRWDEADGATTIDATAVPEVEGETLELDRNLEVHRGQSPAPVCFIYQKGSIMRTFDALVTDGTLPFIYKTLYGAVGTPADATPVNAACNYVALETTYTRSAVRSLKITTPKVAVRPDDFEIGPRAEGGKIPVAFGGQCLKSGATPALTVVAKTGDATSYVA